MSVEAPEMTRDEAIVQLHEVVDTMPEGAAHDFVGLLMDVEAACREADEDFEVQHKETALDTVHATLDEYPEVFAEVMGELLYQLALAELVGNLLA